MIIYIFLTETLIYENGKIFCKTVFLNVKDRRWKESSNDLEKIIIITLT